MSSCVFVANGSYLPFGTFAANDAERYATGGSRPDADMQLTELEKSFQFGMSTGFALRRRFAGGPQ
jgi:hypothetical protein